MKHWIQGLAIDYRDSETVWIEVTPTDILVLTLQDLHNLIEAMQENAGILPE